MEQNTINLPEPKPLRNETEPMPYVVVADDAFPLKSYLMKPFAFRQQDMNQRVFNYRLSRARRIIENVFGICAARFRILRKPIDVHPSRATKIVLAICALHNFLMERKSVYTNSNDFDREINGQNTLGQWRELAEGNSFSPLQSINNGRGSNNANEIRNYFKQHFISQNGEVSWQYTACGYPSGNLN